MEKMRAGCREERFEHEMAALSIRLLMDALRATIQIGNQAASAIEVGSLVSSIRYQTLH